MRSIRNTVTFRQLTPSDIPDMCAIDQQTLRFNWGPTFFAQRMRQFPELFIGAFYDNELIGFVCGCIKDEPISPDVIVRGPYGLISKIAVLPEYTRHGIGTMLLRDLIGAYQFNHPDVAKLIAQVRDDNTSALRFYRQRAFNFTTIALHEYSDGTSGQILLQLL